jgi:hypothetical protein
MNRLIIGEYRIVYPEPETMLLFKNGAGAHLRKHYAPGTYNASAEINDILKCVLKFFEWQIDDLLAPYLHRGFFQGILLQYIVFQRIYEKYIAQKLDANDKAVYEKLLAPSYGRAVKFIAERIALLQDLDISDPPEDGFDETVSALFACAMEVIELSMHSDFTYGVAPLSSAAIVHPAGSDFYLQLRITDENLKHCINEFPNRWRWHVRNWEKIVPEFANQATPEFYSADTFGKHLDQPFQNVNGFSFTNAVNALVEPLASVIPPQDGLPVVFEPRTRILGLAQTNTGLSSKQIEDIFDGFVISSVMIADEGRAFWDPKSESRARRRGIFEIRVAGERHYAWCRELYGEALRELELSATFQDIPLQWRSDEIEKALSALSNEVGKWFEGVVGNELRKIGWKVLTSRSSIGLGNKQLNLPGEIDIVAFWPTERILLVGECKRIRGGTEPSNFFDEIHKFSRKKRPFIARLNMKANFVKHEMKRVCAALESEWNIEVVPQKFARAFITRRPSIAGCFIDATCVSLDEMIWSCSSESKWLFASEWLPETTNS